MPSSRTPLRSVGAAVGFLTRLPVPASWTSSSAMVAGAPAFPLVGAMIGAVVGGTAALAGQVEPPTAAGAMAVGVELLLTGALHADGLADSADALGARSRERALEIMRDHTLGTYGVCAVVMNLLLKAVAIGALEPAPLTAVVVALTLSRAVALPLAVALPYARAAEGTGRHLAGALGWPGSVVAALLAVATSLLLLGAGGVALAATACVVAGMVAVAAWRLLGGVTGDTLGAAVELTATACLLVAAGISR